MQTANKTAWDRLMDSAYDRWQRHQGWTHNMMLAACEGKERQAVLLGNLNSQVLNGGICQYVDNGYATKVRDAIDVLLIMGTETSKTLAEKLKRLIKFVRTDHDDHGFGPNYWTIDDDEEKPHAGHEYANEIDNWYYDNSEKIAAEIEAFLAG